MTRTTVNAKRLRELVNAATTLPWTLWTSNSHRRITGADGRDGGVLYGTKQSDGCDDLAGANAANDLKLIIAAVNALPDLLKIAEAVARFQTAWAADGPSTSTIANLMFELPALPAADALRPTRSDLMNVYEAAINFGKIAGRPFGDHTKEYRLAKATLIASVYATREKVASVADPTPASTPAAKRSDPRCGSQGIDEDGHCVRCGLHPYPSGADVVTHCPPGFLDPDPEDKA